MGNGKGDKSDRHRPATFASPPDSPSLELYGTLAGVGRGLIFYAFLFGLVGHGIGYRVIPCHHSIKSGRKDTKQIDQTPEGQSTALPRVHSPGSRLAFPPVSFYIYGILFTAYITTFIYIITLHITLPTCTTVDFVDTVQLTSAA